MSAKEQPGTVDLGAPVETVMVAYDDEPAPCSDRILARFRWSLLVFVALFLLGDCVLRAACGP